MHTFQVLEISNRNKFALLLTCAIPQTSTSDAQATPVATQTVVQLCAKGGTPQHRSKSMGSSTSCTCPRPHGTWSLTVGGPASPLLTAAISPANIGKQIVSYEYQTPMTVLISGILLTMEGVSMSNSFVCLM